MIGGATLNHHGYTGVQLMGVIGGTTVNHGYKHWPSIAWIGRIRAGLGWGLGWGCQNVGPWHMSFVRKKRGHMKHPLRQNIIRAGVWDPGSGLGCLDGKSRGLWPGHPQPQPVLVTDINCSFIPRVIKTIDEHWQEWSTLVEADTRRDAPAKLEIVSSGL